MEALSQVSVSLFPETLTPFFWPMCHWVCTLYTDSWIHTHKIKTEFWGQKRLNSWKLGRQRFGLRILERFPGLLNWTVSWHSGSTLRKTQCPEHNPKETLELLSSKVTFNSPLALKNKAVACSFMWAKDTWQHQPNKPGTGVWTLMPVASAQEVIGSLAYVPVPVCFHSH